MKIKNRDNIKRFCKYCEHAMQLDGHEMMVCSINGVVPCEYKCRKFSYDPLKREPRRAALDTEGLEFPDID